MEVIIEGKPNQLYAQGLHAYQRLDEAVNVFGGNRGSKLVPQAGKVGKDLQLSDVTIGDLLTNKYAMWIDLRTSDDDKLHGCGRRLENINDGITPKITKSADGVGSITAHVYIFIDAQLNIVSGRYKEIICLFIHTIITQTAAGNILVDLRQSQ